MNKTVILQHDDIERKIVRIAWQIYEDNVSAGELVIMGIREKGYRLAEKIACQLREISPLQITVGAIRVEKHSEVPSVQLELNVADYSKKPVVIVDDVLHTGKTLIYAVREVLSTGVSLLKTVVMIDRNHKKFPVKADYKGFSLSTSMQDHVEMEWKNGKVRVYLV